MSRAADRYDRGMNVPTPAAFPSPEVLAPPALRTARLIVRALDDADRAACEKEYADSEEFWRPFMPSVAANDPIPVQFTQRLARLRDGWRDGSAYRFAAFAGSVYIGDAALNNIVRGAYQNADIGYRVTRAAAGRGLAFEMLSAVLTWAFTPLDQGGAGLHRVQANIMPHNHPSIKLALKLGFRQEGTARGMLHLNGAWQDHIMHAILAEEFIKPSST